MGTVSKILTGLLIVVLAVAILAAILLGMALCESYSSYEATLESNWATSDSYNATATYGAQILELVLTAQADVKATPEP